MTELLRWFWQHVICLDHKTRERIREVENAKRVLDKLLMVAIAILALAGTAHAGEGRRCYFPEGQEYQHCYGGYDYQFWERDYRSRRGCDDGDCYDRDERR